MWRLQSDSGAKRVFSNSVTGSTCTMTKHYVDNEGNAWFGFDDLTAIPYTRNFAATKISSLYTLGLSKDDLTGFISKQKTIIKSNDPEKYEKLFALVLDFESKAQNAADPVKQMSSLVCVYFTLNDEPIDSFEGGLQAKKMTLLEADPEAHAFFLSKQIELTERYMTSLNLISQIVSQKSNGTAVPLM